MTATLTSTDPENDKCPACGKALSLTVSPLPGEIAGLLDWAHKATTIRCDHKDYPGQVGLIEALAAALERMAAKAPLPGEIAEIVESLNDAASRAQIDGHPLAEEEFRAAAAIERALPAEDKP